MGLESYIANQSVRMSEASVAYQASLSMLKKTMDTNEELSAQMLEQMQTMPAPGSHEVGGLLDVYG